MSHALQTLGDMPGLPLDAWTVSEREKCTRKPPTVVRAFLHEHVADAGKALERAEAATTLLLIA
jgi:hypothetical protein